MSGIPAGPFGHILITTAAALLIMMAVTFAVALKVGRHSVVDTAWGIGIALTALVSLLVSAGSGQPALLLSSLTVPEPSTWAMMLLGFAGLGFAGYRRAKAGRPLTSAARSQRTQNPRRRAGRARPSRV